MHTSGRLSHTLQLFMRGYQISHIFFVSVHKIATLKDQLGQELRKRQQFISRSVKAGEEVADIRSMLDTSLGKVNINTFGKEFTQISLKRD